jgi:hypothetical protein
MHPDLTATTLLGVAATIVSVAEATPCVTVVPSGLALPDPLRAHADTLAHRDALPGAAFEPDGFRTLQEAVRAVAEGATGLSLRYVEQLYTFGDRHRDPHELFGGPRSVVVNYLALVREQALAASAAAEWRDLYAYFPWEDWRERRPEVIDAVVADELRAWAEATGDPALRERRRERADLAFGLGGGEWDPERVLERYELLYEAGLVVEASRDRELERRAGKAEPGAKARAGRALGRPMARDGRRALAAALERLRGKLRYRPVVFELLPPAFTLHRLQQVVEALTGKRLHKQNFRRLVTAEGLVEPTGSFDPQTGGRPAELYRYRRRAMHERSSTRTLL